MTTPSQPIPQPCPQRATSPVWQYSDYIEQPTPLLRRERLRCHIREVADRLAGFQSRNGGDGWSYTRYGSLADYLKHLKAELEAMDHQAGRGRRNAFIRMT